MTDTNRPISQYIALKGLTKNAFTTRFPHPFLVEEKLVEAQEQDEPAFATFQATAAELESLLNKELPAAKVQVFPLTKRSSGKFEGMINIGRSMNNDVVLASGAVSKLHAYVRYSPSEQAFFLTDAKSTNGTFINGKRLEPQEKQRLYDGDCVLFTPQFRFRFYTSPAFHDYLTETF
jgi:pSer/pThr/pTyr-binding forkhead associated (FHA) protein